jgi:hypothetical protein
MNSRAHVILELPAPKEVSMILDQNLSAPVSSQDCSRFTMSRKPQSATNTPSYRCSSDSLFSPTASCATLPVHLSSPAQKRRGAPSSDADAQGYTMLLDDTMGSSSWLSHCNHLTHRGGVTSRGQALLEAWEPISAKSVSAGAEAAHRILRQERTAVEILTCAWDGGNEEESEIERRKEIERERQRERERGGEREVLKI